MAQQVPISQSAEAETQRQPDSTATITPDLSYRRLAIVNVVFLGRSHAGAGEWTLIDAGVMGTTPLIRSSAAERFDNAPPAAIVMTHGHFDHVAGLEALSREWNVPVYAHELELPYLNGAASYPPPDPTVGGGLMSAAAPLYPRGPVDVKERLQMLPADGSVPAMPGWRWIHTPGHTPGHVSFWRESDRCLIAGDAFITTAQESAYSVATQAPEMHGPPMYYTQDWAAARESVQRLAALEPEAVITATARRCTAPKCGRRCTSLPIVSMKSPFRTTVITWRSRRVRTTAAHMCTGTEGKTLSRRPQAAGARCCTSPANRPRPSVGPITAST